MHHGKPQTISSPHGQRVQVKSTARLPWQWGLKRLSMEILHHDPGLYLPNRRLAETHKDRVSSPRAGRVRSSSPCHTKGVELFPSVQALRGEQPGGGMTRRSEGRALPLACLGRFICLAEGQTFVSPIRRRLPCSPGGRNSWVASQLSRVRHIPAPPAGVLAPNLARTLLHVASRLVSPWGARRGPLANRRLLRPVPV